MDREQRAAIDEFMKVKAETLALELLEQIVMGEREADLDTLCSWELYVTMSERGPRHCLNN